MHVDSRQATPLARRVCAELMLTEASLPYFCTDARPAPIPKQGTIGTQVRAAVSLPPPLPFLDSLMLYTPGDGARSY
jgi:hypothetical protein